MWLETLCFRFYSRPVVDIMLSTLDMVALVTKENHRQYQSTHGVSQVLNG